MATAKYIRNNAGTLTETTASVTSTADAIVAMDAGGHLDASVLPSGVGAATAVIVASEALSAGNFVNVWNNAGTPNVRKADASTTGKEAHGFVLASVASSGNATVYFDDLNTSLSSLTGGEVYLSDSTPGAVTQTVPTTAGHIVQRLGPAVSATTVNVQIQPPIVLA